MAPKLYYADVSPPVRSVLLTAKALGLELDLINLNIYAGEHMKPEFVKLNPQHTIPTLDDNGYVLWDSHAITTYLAAKYGKDDSLYPKDLQKRGLVDQRLHFSSGTMQPRAGAILKPLIRDGAKILGQKEVEEFCQAYDFMELFLEGREFLAGNNLTVADMCIVTTLSTLEPFVNLNPAKNPRLCSWYKRMQALPYYKEANQVGCDKLIEFVKSKLA